VVVAIQSWVYEAQANMYSGSTVKLRTAVFADVCEDLLNAHRIKPAQILGNLEEAEYFQINSHTDTYEPIKVSKIAKLESLAKNGDIKALYELGLAYVTGEVVKKDESRAQMLLYKSYLRGNIEAIFALVDLFDEPIEHFRNEAAKHR
jgi:TPR repeat protein